MRHDPRTGALAFTSDLVRILESVVAGESMVAMYERREHALMHLFSRLGPEASLAWHRRLSNPAKSDPCRLGWLEMTSERRNRLLACLADPRRP